MQDVLFADPLSRMALLKIDALPDTSKHFRVNVWRNHAFEGLVSLIEPYAQFCGWTFDFNLGAYDDSLSFNGHQMADLELIWLDSTRYAENGTGDFWKTWLKSRMTFLRDQTKAPIIFCSWGASSAFSQEVQSVLEGIPDAHFADLAAACSSVGVQLVDQRTAALSGTPIGNAAQVVLAREMTCRWMAAVLMPPIKAIAVDLDNTLHKGILGEDGIQGVELTPGHADLQQLLKSLIEKGIFVALVSKNERTDVETLFQERHDYPLKLHDFSAVEVSWGDKASALERAAQTLRISPDAVLFVDDNIGELADITLSQPNAHTVFAAPDAILTRRTIEYYPGLWRWHVGDDDSKRIQDLKANTERERLKERFENSSQYFENLKVSLTFRRNSREQLPRLADLCAKTNQFNLAFQRLSQSELSNLMQREDAAVVSVQLSDLLSDSGVVGVVAATRQGDDLIVEELCVSCRALGRRLEDAMIMLSLQNMEILQGCKRIVFRAVEAPRNQPALNWLAELTGLPQSKLLTEASLPIAKATEFQAEQGILLNMEE
ncbi:MAG: HAD-IIIC family phosphatase [Parvibaculaceae bacterium]